MAKKRLLRWVYGEEGVWRTARRPVTEKDAHRPHAHYAPAHSHKPTAAQLQWPVGSITIFREFDSRQLTSDPSPRSRTGLPLRATPPLPALGEGGSVPALRYYLDIFKEQALPPA